LTSTPRPPRQGFTLIELLVVIAIIGVLVGLMLPAIQLTRENARRLQCSNNLKQIGLALAGYVDRQGGLPPGYVSKWDQRLEFETGPGWGWATKILADLEQTALANEIQFDRNIQDPVNATVRLRRISTYLCPSDTMPRSWTTSSGAAWIYANILYLSQNPICDVAGANYVGVFGIGEPGVDGDGVFYRNSFVTPQDIRDGLSQTLAVGERSVNLKAGFPEAVVLGTPTHNVGQGHATWVGAVPGSLLWTCAPSPYDPDGGTCRKEEGAGMVLGHTGEGNGPGDPNCDVNQFLSQHGRGSHFLYCDGHVQFLRGGMNYATYKALSTRASGEVISDDY
jgi:prepilin-type N-terminal cleavage/methylation domain-containing protein/prepilin-type processing-associated H-X9-DG protein